MMSLTLAMAESVRWMGGTLVVGAGVVGAGVAVAGVTGLVVVAIVFSSILGLHSDYSRSNRYL
jgi:hypothetical protein